MENNVLNALDFIFKSDPKAQEAVDNGFDIARRYSDEEWLSKMVAYASACSAPSSIGEDDYNKLTGIAAWFLNEDEGDFERPAAEYLLNLRYRLSERKIVLPSDDELAKWYDLWIAKGCSASSAIHKFRNWLKELNGINPPQNEGE